MAGHANCRRLGSVKQWYHYLATPHAMQRSRGIGDTQSPTLAPLPTATFSSTMSLGNIGAEREHLGDRPYQSGGQTLPAKHTGLFTHGSLERGARHAAVPRCICSGCRSPGAPSCSPSRRASALMAVVLCVCASLRRTRQAPGAWQRDPTRIVSSIDMYNNDVGKRFMK